MPNTLETPLRFGSFTLDARRCALWRGDQRLALRPKSFDVLVYMARRAGRLVTKDELVQAVWPHTAVTDDALVQCIRDIRAALDDREHQIVRTLPRRGYLFEALPATPPAAEASTGTAPLSPQESLHFCRTPDGVRIAAASTGQGLPLVRTPTWFNHLQHDWHVQFRGAFYRFLAERVRLVRYDGRGSGLSDRYVSDFSLAGFEHDLQTVVDSLALPRYALLGVSQGGAIAITHALAQPERVSRLVLIGAFALGRNRRGRQSDLETGQAQLTLMRHGWGDEHSAFLKAFSMLYFPGAPASELKALAELQRMAMSADNALRLRSVSDDIDIEDRLPQVQAPTLILHSRHDNAVPLREGERMASLMPNARLVVLESDNHLPLPEEPAWPGFLREIDAFLRD